VTKKGILSGLVEVAYLRNPFKILSILLRKFFGIHIAHLLLVFCGYSNRIPGKAEPKGGDQMVHTKILLVEDERIVTKDIESRLKILGYPSPAIASSGMEAIKKAAEYHPDLVLIDIQLKGEMDGIKAARQIYDRFGIPVIYLMDDADEETLKDDKVIEPFHYVLKPCEEFTLHVSIEKAIYKHKMEKLWKSFDKQNLGKEAR
jgi:CheY-like chemotaxis protein